MAEIDRKVQLMPYGSGAGWLLEEKARILEKLGRIEAAIAAYEAAARAYGMSPEASMMPVVHADEARQKAEALRQKYR